MTNNINIPELSVVITKMNACKLMTPLEIFVYYHQPRGLNEARLNIWIADLIDVVNCKKKNTDNTQDIKK